MVVELFMAHFISSCFLLTKILIFFLSIINNIYLFSRLQLVIRRTLSIVYVVRSGWTPVRQNCLPQQKNVKVFELGTSGNINWLHSGREYHESWRTIQHSLETWSSPSFPRARKEEEIPPSLPCPTPTPTHLSLCGFMWWSAWKWS